MNYFIIFAIFTVALAFHGEDKYKQQKCPGGKCVSKYLCTNGTLNNDGHIHLSLDDVDECSDYLMVCCNTVVSTEIELPFNTKMRIEGDSSEDYGSTCGIMNENGLFYELHSNETLAQYGEFPWVVFIVTANETFVCGGALIHPLYVLTTAHNVAGKTNLKARFGEWDIGTDKELFPHQEITVDEIIIHPAYSLTPIKNDIALLALETGVLYQVHIQPICLPQETDEFDGERCISNGWGSTEGSYARIMKKISLPVIPRVKCQRMLQFAGLGPLYRLPEGFMCAGGEANVDTCKGDGGSPLACRRPDDNFVLAGIVSWGIGCGGQNLPGAYVAVSKYVSWINSNIYPEDKLEGMKV